MLHTKVDPRGLLKKGTVFQIKYDFSGVLIYIALYPIEPLSYNQWQVIELDVEKIIKGEPYRKYYITISDDNVKDMKILAGGQA